MTWFKPGDKVTCLGHPGEWEVWGDDDRAASMTVLGVPCTVVVQGPPSGQKQMCLVPIDTLTFVAPAPIPDPPVGSVGFVDGEPWLGGRDFGWYCLVRNRGSLTWDGIADRFVPAVPQPTVDEMAEALTPWSNVDGLTTTERARIIMHNLGWEVPGE